MIIDTCEWGYGHYYQIHVQGFCQLLQYPVIITIKAETIIITADSNNSISENLANDVKKK